MWSSIIQWDFFACAEGLGKDNDGKIMLSLEFSQYSKKAMPDLGHKIIFFSFYWYSPFVDEMVFYISFIFPGPFGLLLKYWRLCLGDLLVSFQLW